MVSLPFQRFLVVVVVVVVVLVVMRHHLKWPIKDWANDDVFRWSILKNKRTRESKETSNFSNT